MATHKGHVIATVVGSSAPGNYDDPQPWTDATGPQRYKFAAGRPVNAADVTGVPSAQYTAPPEALVCYCEADEAWFIAQGADTLWYEAI